MPFCCEYCYEPSGFIGAEGLFSHVSDVDFIAGVLRGIIPRRIPVSTSYNVSFILKSLY